MKDPVSLAGFDDERAQISFTVPIKGRRPATVKIPRFDYIPEDVFDAMMADLESLDVVQQVHGVANDLTEAGEGADVQWELLLDGAKKQLTELGVTVTRAMSKGMSRDVVCAPDSAVLEALAPLAAEKPLTLRKRSREICLTMLKHVVAPHELEWFEALPSGALDDVLAAWKDQSTMTLGESDASS